MSDRAAQAKAEAERQFPDGTWMAREQDRIIFTKGWEAADASRTITRAKAVADRHPDPRCDKYSSGDAVTCGWKGAYIEMLDALGIEEEDSDD